MCVYHQIKASKPTQVKCNFTQMCAQTIFSLMDYMMLWIKKKRSSIGDEKSKTKSPASQLVKRVEMVCLVPPNIHSFMFNACSLFLQTLFSDPK